VREGRAPDSRPPDPTADSDARREFRVRVRDHLDDGWELTEDHGDRVVLVARDIGSIPAHVLLLLTTGGVGNLLYGWYNYAELAETRRLSVSDGPLPDGELGRPATATRSSPSPATSWAAFSCWSGSGSPPSRSGRGARLGALFGLAFAALGLALSPPAERRLDRRHGLSRFGRIRTVDHRITPSTERTEAPCVVCGEAFERGVVRRRRDETVVAGVPIRTHSLRCNHYCAGCARAELFGGDADETAIDPDVSLDDSEFDDSEFDDSEFGRDEETERERERER